MKLKVTPAINTDFVVTVSTFATDGQKIGTSFFTGTKRVHHGKGILHIFNLSLGKRRPSTKIMAKFVQPTDAALKWYWFSFFFFFFWRLIFWISWNTVFVLVLVRIKEAVRWRLYFFAHDLVFIWRDSIVNAAKDCNNNFEEIEKLWRITQDKKWVIRTAMKLKFSKSSESNSSNWRKQN